MEDRKITIDTEKAFDMLPYVADIYEKIDIGKYIANKRFEIKKEEVKRKKKDHIEVEDVKVMGYGLDMFAYIMKNTPKIKTEFFEIVAIIEDKKVEEVKKQSLAETIKTIKLLVGDVETMDFFTQAMK